MRKYFWEIISYLVIVPLLMVYPSAMETYLPLGAPFDLIVSLVFGVCTAYIAHKFVARMKNHYPNPTLVRKFADSTINDVTVMSELNLRFGNDAELKHEYIRRLVRHAARFGLSYKPLLPITNLVWKMYMNSDVRPYSVGKLRSVINLVLSVTALLAGNFVPFSDEVLLTLFFGGSIFALILVTKMVFFWAKNPYRGINMSAFEKTLHDLTSYRPEVPEPDILNYIRHMIAHPKEEIFGETHQDIVGAYQRNLH